MDLHRLDHMPSVKLAMTPFPHAIDVGAPLSRAREMMLEYDIHHLPVTERGELVGVISAREVAIGTSISSARSPAREPSVGEACARHAYVVEDAERLDHVLLRMAEERVGCALVLRRGKLVGIFTTTDACRSFADWLRAHFPDPGGDEAA
jgi:CBS domain-containing protein